MAACICGKDGVISEPEESKMLELLSHRFPECSSKLFEEGLEEFFESERSIESLLALIDDESIRKAILEIAEISAAVDGLDPRENVALDKSYKIWGIARDV